ncbi:MAG: hypothetical protein H6709_05420 [Kofleriaceae bacterium]|nr:hypothetical protein [Kofleriaceae bacterium]MCB9571512.1 hypothetical protein [Kofleriaceae bacterium]
MAAPLALTGCGDDESTVDAAAIDAPRPDAAATIDADTSAPDADTSGPDAMPAPDAAPSNVQVVDCAGLPTTDLTTSGFNFSPMGDITIAVDGVIKFIPQAQNFHNFASASGAPADKQFRSGAVGHSNTVCLKFTVAGSYPFVCEAHPTMMNGNVVVQ